jgi:MoxR-like ATPase
MNETLREMAHRNPTIQILADNDYSLTLDNFYKMCLIVQRMRANIPIIIMGETGVGKTALIRHLVQNVFRDKLVLFNVHAGTNEAQLIKFDEEIRRTYEDIQKMHDEARKVDANLPEKTTKMLWVFFDEFNTTEEVGYIKEIIM